MRIIIIALLFSLIGICSIAQDLDVVKTEIYNFSSDEYLVFITNSGIVTTDNNLVIVGAAPTQEAFPYSDVFIMKINLNGDTLWTKTIGTTLTNDVGINVIQTQDGNLVALCIVQFEGNFGRLRLYKLDLNGNIIWEKTYLAETEYALSHGITESTDGGLMISGMCDGDIFIFKTNTDGDSLWVSYFGTDYNDNSDAIAATDDGGAVMAGRISSSSANNDSLIIIRVNSLGDEIWSNTYPMNGGDGFWGKICLRKNTDGHYVLVSSSDEGSTISLFEFDIDGITLDSSKITLAEPAMIQAINHGNDNSLWLTGELFSNGTIVAKFNSTLDSLLTAQVGTSDFSTGDFIYQDNNDYIYIVGRYSHNNIYFMKLMETIAAGIPDNEILIPQTSFLTQNYPNPFNLSTQIKYSVTSSSHVLLEIYDILGRKVKTIVDATQSFGLYSIAWDGADDYGNAVSSGIYLYRLIIDDFVESKTMLLLK
ncbi:MAG: FlgD immunoglobulin-like domain containing protein [Candidatus Zixiibacteriota bacterium]